MNKSSFNYEDLRDYIELEIFGLKFGINDSKEYIERLNNVANKVKYEKLDDEESIKLINVILDDEKAYDKIKEKYEKDLGKEISVSVWLQIYEYIMNKVNTYKRYNNKKQYRKKTYRGRNYRRY